MGTAKVGCPVKGGAGPGDAGAGGAAGGGPAAEAADELRDPHYSAGGPPLAFAAAAVAPMSAFLGLMVCTGEATSLEELWD